MNENKRGLEELRTTDILDTDTKGFKLFVCCAAPGYFLSQLQKIQSGFQWVASGLGWYLDNDNYKIWMVYPLIFIPPFHEDWSPNDCLFLSGILSCSLVHVLFLFFPMCLYTWCPHRLFPHHLLWPDTKPSFFFLSFPLMVASKLQCSNNQRNREQLLLHA